MHATKLWVGVGLFLTAGMLHGGLIASRSLLELEQKADLIVVGSATADISVGSASANFSLQVNRVITGDASIAGTSIAVSWTSVTGLLTGVMAPRGTHIAENGTGLWFLQRSSNVWLLLPVMSGGIGFQETYFPVPAGPITAAYTYGPTAALSDKIASELAAAIEAAPSNNMTLKSLNYSLLDELRSPILQVLYKRMSTSASTPQRILGLSGLVRGGNESALTAAATAAASSQFEGYAENSILLYSIRNEFRATDANSIAALGRSAVDSKDPNLTFREAAAHALAAIHTVDALPYLATLLDDPDESLRIEAIGGLGAFANGLQPQTTSNTPSLASLQLTGSAPYRTPDTIANFAQGEQAISRNEAAYLEFWKNWWTSHRISLGY